MALSIDTETGGRSLKSKLLERIRPKPIAPVAEIPAPDLKELVTHREFEIIGILEKGGLSELPELFKNRGVPNHFNAYEYEPALARAFKVDAPSTNLTLEDHLTRQIKIKTKAMVTAKRGGDLVAECSLEEEIESLQKIRKGDKDVVSVEDYLRFQQVREVKFIDKIINEFEGHSRGRLEDLGRVVRSAKSFLVYRKLRKDIGDVSDLSSQVRLECQKEDKAGKTDYFTDGTSVLHASSEIRPAGIYDRFLDWEKPGSNMNNTFKEVAYDAFWTLDQKQQAAMIDWVASVGQLAGSNHHGDFMLNDVEIKKRFETLLDTFSPEEKHGLDRLNETAKRVSVTCLHNIARILFSGRDVLTYMEKVILKNQLDFLSKTDLFLLSEEFRSIFYTKKQIGDWETTFRLFFRPDYISRNAAGLVVPRDNM